MNKRLALRGLLLAAGLLLLVAAGLRALRADEPEQLVDMRVRMAARAREGARRRRARGMERGASAAHGLGRLVPADRDRNRRGECERPARADRHLPPSLGPPMQRPLHQQHH